MDHSAGIISPRRASARSREQRSTYFTNVEGRRKSLHCFSPSSPSSSSSSPSSGCPQFPLPQMSTSSDEVDGRSCSGGSVFAKEVVAAQNYCMENTIVNPVVGIADGCRNPTCSPAAFKRRRGMQSRGVVPSWSPSKLNPASGEQSDKEKTFFSVPDRKLLKGDSTSYDAQESKLGTEEDTVETEHLPPSPGSFVVCRGCQSVVSSAQLRLQPLDGASKDTTGSLKRLPGSTRVCPTIEQRKVRLCLIIFSVLAVSFFGVTLHSSFKEAYSTAACVHPVSTWLSQKFKVFYFFGELGAIVMPLLYEFSKRFAPSLLDPVEDTSGILDLRMRAASYLSYIRLSRTRSEKVCKPSTASTFPTVEQLQSEFSQYAAGRVPATETLREHSKEFERKIIRVTEDVYVAVGFGLANCVIINAPGGLILVDTMESTSAMGAVWRAWMKLPEAKTRRGNNDPMNTHQKKEGGRSCSKGINGTMLARCSRDRIMCTRSEALFRHQKRSCAPLYKRNVAGKVVMRERCATILCKQRKRTKSTPSARLAERSPSVKAIIYTHFHTDHVFGAAAVAQPDTEVHAYWLTYAEMSKVFTLTAGTTYRRSMRQFGVFVDEHDFLNAGIGPALHYSSREEIGTVLPTHVMHTERKTLEIAGMKLEMIHAPGESKDQLVVWLPEKKLLIGADNVYKSMPNIYAIRGTETRDCNDWIASLDMMRSLQPEFLVLGHTQPLSGREYIASTLLAYRDAIQFIHDQTLRYMNKGYYANDIAHMVKLPPHLESHPFLQPFYGTVPWAVKAIFTHYVGWFSGTPEDLAVMSTKEKAETLVSLAGNVQNLLSHALQNLRGGHVQRALEFASAAHHVSPASAEAKTLKILALRATAAKQQAATGRNWFLTAALELEGRAQLRLSDSQKRQTLSKLSMQQIFELLPARLVPERAADLECVLEFNFTDVEEHVCVHYRRGIAYQKWPCEKPADVVVKTTREVWLGILNKDRSPALAVVAGDLHVTGSLVTLARALLSVELEAD